jgi:drug/metabolite transporter (DMT)-like permease
LTEPTELERQAGIDRARHLGLLAVAIAVVCFSVSSSVVKKSGAPGAAIAFWRLLAAAILWNAILLARGGRPRWSTTRKLALPGAFFGVNLSLFFVAVNHTSIAHAEFLSALTPLILLPAGSWLFHERVDGRALAWGTVALGGMALVLFAGPAKGAAKLSGDLIVLGAVLCWSGYLLLAKRARVRYDVVELMAGITPIATLAIVPVLIADGTEMLLPWRGWVVVGILAFMTGLGAHGLIVFAQRALPVATIGMLQVAQPALAVGWAFLLLDEEIRPIQIVGMALVLVGLALFTWSSQRRVRAS